MKRKRRNKKSDKNNSTLEVIVLITATISLLDKLIDLIEKLIDKFF